MSTNPNAFVYYNVRVYQFGSIIQLVPVLFPEIPLNCTEKMFFNLLQLCKYSVLSNERLFEFEEGTLHSNYLSNQFPWHWCLNSEITVCITVKIQNLAIEMCAECTVTLLYCTCTQLGLHSQHSGRWEVLQTSSGMHLN